MACTNGAGSSSELVVRRHCSFSKLGVAVHLLSLSPVEDRLVQRRNLGLGAWLLAHLRATVQGLHGDQQHHLTAFHPRESIIAQPPISSAP